MAKTKISEYSATSADNTDISNINIAEGCSPANVNNAIRTVMAQLKDQQTGTSGDPFTCSGTLTSSGTIDITGGFKLDGSAGTAGQALVSAGSATPTWSALGTIASQNANAVAITGGTITGITDLTVADGGTGVSTLSANAVLLGNGTSALQTVAPSTSGNVLTSNGTTWTSAALNFDKSLTTNGYQKIPGGLIVQWGTTSSISVDGSVTVTYPIAFPNAAFVVFATPYGWTVSGGPGPVCGPTSWNATTATIQNDGSTASTCSWLAIGY
jgi:hypothetical protein